MPTIERASTASSAEIYRESRSATGAGHVVTTRITNVVFSSNVEDPLRDLLVEEPIDYVAEVGVLRRLPVAEEEDFSVGGPFGA